MTLALDDTVHQQSHSLISQNNLEHFAGHRLCQAYICVNAEIQFVCTWYVLGKVTKERET